MPDPSPRNSSQIFPAKSISVLAVAVSQKMSSVAAAEQMQIASPPTYRFRPKKRELVEFYLLPRSRGQDPFPGVLIEDDAAGSTLPWDLFDRHGLGSEDEAYFVVRAVEAKKKPGARQDRACDGGVGTWKMQSSAERSLRVRGGERVRVHVSNLNLHMGKGKSSGGSVGWVMHEYSIASPPCPSPVKICHIAFSGHGRKRMRVPDGQQVRQSSLPVPGSSEFQGFPSAASQQFTELEAQVPATEEQDIVVPQLMSQQATMPVELSEGDLEFWSSIGVDVQSNDSFDQEPSTAGVQSSWVAPNNSAMATVDQSSWVMPNNSAMATGLQSSSMVPNTGAMATGVQSCSVVPNTGTMATGVQSSWLAGDLDDCCRSILGNVQTNCSVPDFSFNNIVGGGCSLLCK